VHFRLLALTVVAAPTLPGCGADPSDVGAGFAVRTEAIVKGEPSDAGDDAVAFVKAYPPDLDATHCTGTFVAGNLIVTALHCVSHHLVEALFSCNPDGTLEPQEPGGGILGAVVAPEMIEIRLGPTPGNDPDAIGARVFTTGSTQICRNDLAVILLDRDLDVEPRALRWDAPVEVGDTVTAIGYGATGLSGPISRFRREGLRVLASGPDSNDEPSRTAAPRTFMVGEGPCHGDSGGPAFAESSGALIGVYSLLTTGSCTALGVRNVFTKVAPFRDLLSDAFEAAGAEPLLEVLPEPPPPSEPRSNVDPLGGSGSRDEPSCACRLGPPRPASAEWLAGLAFFASVVVRRRRRAQ
jgi:MYXO-CTERM domain-containing protein